MLHPMHALGLHFTICGLGLSLSVSHTLYFPIKSQHCWRKGFSLALPAQLQAQRSFWQAHNPLKCHHSSSVFSSHGTPDVSGPLSFPHPHSHNAADAHGLLCLLDPGFPMQPFCHGCVAKSPHLNHQT